MLESRILAITLFAAVVNAGVVPTYPLSAPIAKISSPLPYAAPRLTYTAAKVATPVAYAAQGPTVVSHSAPLAYASHAAPVAYASHAAPVQYAAPAQVAYASHAAPVHYAAPPQVAYASHAAPVHYAAPAQVAYASHAAPVAYASHAAPVAYASHAAPVAYASHAAPVHYAAPAPVAYAAHAPVVAKAVAPVAYAKAVDTDYDPNPSYTYAYDIQDALTGDSKSQHESRQGDTVQGSYSLVEPDGTRRTVEYTADPVNGFNAVVHREPAVQKAIVAAPAIAKVAHPVAYAAPVAGYAKTIATYH